ncbi:MAG: PAAR domain-containing protein [Chitinophagaceae bacterium]|nr:PAAR domain-containing protein [Chitinophagaceae bacterium]
MAAAARAGDAHICPMFSGNAPHVGGPINPPGNTTVLVGGLPAACVGDFCTCAVGPPDAILKGSSTVLIGGKPAARFGDTTSHGGKIMAGTPTVIIGG